MFGSKKSNVGAIESLIGAGTVVEGHLRFKGGLRIDGEVLGSVTAVEASAGSVTISEQGKVVGPLHAAHLVINGTVEGPVHAEETVEVQSKARITGNVRYRTLEMHAGAMIDGALSPLENERPALKLAVNKD